MWYKEKYRIVTENPYNKEKLNGLGLVIYSEWKDSFVNIIQKNEIKHLFLNYSLGWKCSDYTFLRYIKPIETLEIIDTHSVGIKNVEQQHELVTLCLNLPNANDIDYHAFYHLKNVFCYGDKRNDAENGAFPPTRNGCIHSLSFHKYSSSYPLFGVHYRTNLSE